LTEYKAVWYYPIEMKNYHKGEPMKFEIQHRFSGMEGEK